MSLGSLLGGKTKKYKADPLAKDINAAGKFGINQMTDTANQLNKEFYDNPSGYIDGQIGLENKMLRGSANDSSRRLGEIIAQRGMGTSSIGIGEQINQEKNLNDAIALNNASGASRLKDLLGEKMNLGQSMWNVKASQGPVQMQSIKQREGGLAPLIGGLAGAYMGAKSGNMTGGAQVGMGLGQYLTA